MLRFIKKILYLFAYSLRLIADKIYTSEHDKLVKLWYSEGGIDKKITFNINESSVVFDVGGYDGQWTSDIMAKYLCTIHVFEPVTDFADRITQRFKDNKRVISNSFGLSDSNKKIQISLEGVRSSEHNDKKNVKTQIAEVRDILEYINDYNLKSIDLIKLNIEGAEYALLNHLINADKIILFKSIFIQFHDINKNSSHEVTKIRKVLGRTHECKFSYEFVWECWEIKAN